MCIHPGLSVYGKPGTVLLRCFVMPLEEPAGSRLLSRHFGQFFHICLFVEINPDTHNEAGDILQ